MICGKPLQENRRLLICSPAFIFSIEKPWWVSGVMISFLGSSSMGTQVSGVVLAPRPRLRKQLAASVMTFKKQQSQLSSLLYFLFASSRSLKLKIRGFEWQCTVLCLCIVSTESESLSTGIQFWVILASPQ